MKTWLLNLITRIGVALRRRWLIAIGVSSAGAAMMLLASNPVIGFGQLFSNGGNIVPGCGQIAATDAGFTCELTGTQFLQSPGTQPIPGTYVGPLSHGESVDYDVTVDESAPNANGFTQTAKLSVRWHGTWWEDAGFTSPQGSGASYTDREIGSNLPGAGATIGYDASAGGYLSVNSIASGSVFAGATGSIVARPAPPGFDAGAAPTITSISQDFASANGGEPFLTIYGTNLTGCAVTVDANAATVTGSSATTCVFTTPASSVSPTDGNPAVSTVTVTTGAGSIATTGTPGDGLWYIPAYLSVPNAGLWSAQSVTTSSGNVATVADLTANGHVLSLSASGTAPPFTVAGTGGATSYWTSANTGAASLVNTSFPLAALTVEWAIAAESTVASASTDHVLAALFSGSSAASEFLDQVTGASLTQENGSAGVNNVTLTANTPFGVTSFFNNTTASQQVLNGASPVTGGNPGNARTPAGGVAVGGGLTGGSVGWAGPIYFIAAYPAALSTNGRANFAAYFAHEGI